MVIVPVATAIQWGPKGAGLPAPFPSRSASDHCSFLLGLIHSRPTSVATGAFSFALPLELEGGVSQGEYGGMQASYSSC